MGGLGRIDGPPPKKRSGDASGLRTRLIVTGRGGVETGRRVKGEVMRYWIPQPLAVSRVIICGCLG